MGAWCLMEVQAIGREGVCGGARPAQRNFEHSIHSPAGCLALLEPMLRSVSCPNPTSLPAPLLPDTLGTKLASVKTKPASVEINTSSYIPLGPRSSHACVCAYGAFRAMVRTKAYLVPQCNAACLGGMWPPVRAAWVPCQGGMWSRRDFSKKGYACVFTLSPQCDKSFLFRKGREAHTHTHIHTWCSPLINTHTPTMCYTHGIAH